MSHIPVWVFGLLALLLLLGYRQSRPRELAPTTVFAIAAGMVWLSLFGVISAFSGAPLPLAGWLLGMGLTVSFCGRVLVPRGIAFIPARGRVHIPGSWVPMALILGIFAIKFGLAFSAGIGQPVLPHSVMAFVAALFLGSLSGGFAARAVEVFRVSRATACAALPQAGQGSI